MNTKRIALVLALGCILGLAAFAQAADVPMISLENGYSLGYSFSGSALGTAFDLTLGFGLSDKIQAQASFLQGDGGATVFHNYRLLGLAYSMMPKLGVTVLLGQDTTATAAVVGLGLYSTLLSRDNAGLRTTLKLRLDYIAPVTSYSTGIIRLGLAAGLGM
jgi:hypothetical protein